MTRSNDLRLVFELLEEAYNEFSLKTPSSVADFLALVGVHNEGKDEQELIKELRTIIRNARGL